MTLPTLPKSLLIVGAGAIGVEFASLYRSLGTDVTIVELLDRLVPLEDEAVSAELAKAFRTRTIHTHTGHKVLRAVANEDGITTTIEPVHGGPAIAVTTDVILVAAGIAGNVANLGLEDIGIDTTAGFLDVDEHYQTAVRGVHAIGDVIGRKALAHVASAEGVYVAEHIAGTQPHPVPYDAIPSCTYCHPEIASVGLTEANARASGLDIKVGVFPFGPLGKTLAAGEYPGFAKFIWDARGALVGAHLIGPAVTDLIAVPTLAKTTEVNAESYIHTVHAHPTFAEALKEAAEAAYGKAIHI